MNVWCNTIVYYYTCIYVSTYEYFIRFKAVGQLILYYYYSRALDKYKYYICVFFYTQLVSLTTQLKLVNEPSRASLLTRYLGLLS